MIHFLHIGKTGGTALRFALTDVGGTNFGSVKFHNHATKLRDIPRGEKVVFFLRDPIARFVSGFYSRKRKGAPRYRSPWSNAEHEAFDRFDTPAKLLRFAVDPDRRKQLHAIDALLSIGHVNQRYRYWLESTDYLNSRIDDLLHIGMLESLPRDFELLKTKLGLSPSLLLPKSDVEAHVNPSYQNPSLTVAEKEFLKGWIWSDYELQDYCRTLRSNFNE